MQPHQCTQMFTTTGNERAPSKGISLCVSRHWLAEGRGRGISHKEEGRAENGELGKTRLVARTGATWGHIVNTEGICEAK